MKYQLEHDKSLNAIKPFLYEEKNEMLTGISIWLRFEPIFNNIEKNPRIKIGEQVLGYNQLVKISFNNETKEFSISKNLENNIDYEIVSYSKAVSEKEESGLTKRLNNIVGFNVPMSYDTPIEKNEFEFIINKYSSLFENDNSLQTLGINWYEL